MNKKLALVSIAVVAATGAGCASKSEPSTVADKAGASSCEDSTYWMQSRFPANAPKEYIYNCVVNGKERCVVLLNGVARDATEEVRFTFEDAYQKPECVK